MSVGFLKFCPQIPGNAVGSGVKNTPKYREPAGHLCISSQGACLRPLEFDCTATASTNTVRTSRKNSQDARVKASESESHRFTWWLRSAPRQIYLKMYNVLLKFTWNVIERSGSC